MKRILTFEKLNEAIHNQNLVISEVKKMLTEISKIQVLTRGNLGENNIEKDTRQVEPNYIHFTIKNMDPKNAPKIENILRKYQNVILPKIDIVMKYKEYKNADMKMKDDGDDPLDFDVLDTYTLTYIAYLKNIYIQRVKPSRFVYHCSDKKNRNSIKKNGLIPKSDKESKIWKYQTDVIYPAAVFATNNTLWDSTNDVWVIDTKGLPNKWWYDLYFRKYDGKILTFEPIPPNHLELINKEKEDVWDRVSMNKTMPY